MKVGFKHNMQGGYRVNTHSQHVSLKSVLLTKAIDQDIKNMWYIRRKRLAEFCRPDTRGTMDRLSLLWAVEMHSSKHAFKYRL